MTAVFPTEAARHEHMAGVYRFAAEEFASGSPARQAFAPTLELWAAKREAAAIAARTPDQPDLFIERAA